MSKDNRLLQEFARFWLEHSTYNVKTLAEHFNVSRKHIYALKKKLQAQGIALYLAKDQPDGFPIARGHMAISDQGREQLRNWLELGSSQTNYHILADALYVPLNSECYIEDVLATLLQAIHERRVVTMRYRNSQNGAQTSYNVHCYRLVVRENHLYVYGIDHISLQEDRRPQLRRVDRIRAIALCDEYFIKTSEEMERHIDWYFGAFGYGEGQDVDVCVHFDKSKTPIVKASKRHIAEEHRELEDGSVLWSTTMPITDSLVRWIVSYGAAAEVLEPSELRQMVREFAEGTVRANAPK